MADFATLGLKLDATSATKNAGAYASALKRVRQEADHAGTAQKKLENSMRQAASTAGNAARQAAVAQIEAAERVFRQGQAILKAELYRGLLTPEEAAQLGRLNAQEYNSAVLATLDQNAGALSGEAGAEAFTAIAGSIKNVDEAGKRAASGGVGTLNQSFASLITQVAGTDPVIGNLVNTLGSFAVGSAFMLPVLAGLVAIGYAWKAWTRDAREAREAVKEAREELERLAEVRGFGIGGSTVGAVATLREEISRFEAELSSIAALRAGWDRRIVQGTEARRTFLVEQLAILRELVRTGEEAIGEAQADAYEAATAKILAMTIAANQERMRLEAVMANPAKVQQTLANLRTDLDFEERAERIAAERDEISQFVLWTISNFKRAEKEKTKIATQEAKERAKAEAEEQRELMRKIALFAKGANILGNVIGGAFGAGLQGAAGGAATGGAIGGLPGAIIGGTLGFVQGIFGHAKKAKEAAELAREAERIEGQALASRRARVRDDLMVRGLSLGGDQDAAARAGLAARHRQELEGASGLDPDTHELLRLLQALEMDSLIRQQQADKLIRVAEDQLTALDDQIREQEKTVDGLRTVLEGVSEFADSLTLSALSPSSPADRLAEAKAQFEAVAALAAGGDLSAAESLPDASRAFLDASRAYNASGAAFVADFNMVQSVLATVQAGLAGQLSTEESALATMVETRDLIAAELEEIIRQTEEANARAREAYEQMERLFGTAVSNDRDRDDNFNEDTGDADVNGDDLLVGLDAIVDAIVDVEKAITKKVGGVEF